MWGSPLCLPCSYFQPTYSAVAQGGGGFSGVAMSGGDSFCMDDSLGMEASHGNEGNQYISNSMPQEGL